MTRNVTAATEVTFNLADPTGMTEGDNLWSTLATLVNVDELVDETALAARESSSGKAAYEILRRASDNAIETLEGRLRRIDARNSGA